MKYIVASAVLMAAAGAAFRANAEEPVTLATVVPPGEIAQDEPIAKVFSLERAAHYLDSAALDWQKTHECTACHTMLPYLMARPALTAVSPQSAEVRQFFEEIVAGKREAMPNYTCNDVDGAVAVGIAAAMAINDRCTTGKLHPLTRQALDRMWTFQRPGGDWQWPFRDTPPLKIDEQYGVTLAAIAAGMAPEAYVTSPAATTGLQGIRKFLRRTPAMSLHQRGMTLWASAYVDELLSGDEKTEILSALLAVQRPDGGWSLASLVDNTNAASLKDSDQAIKAKAEQGYGTEFLTYIGREKVYKSSLTSDGYATGFAIFVSRQAGLSASDSRLQRGIAWLKGNQREGGRWFTPSQAWHTQNMIANAGTAYAVLALGVCGEIPLTRESNPLTRPLPLSSLPLP